MKTVLKICASGLKEVQDVAARSIWWYSLAFKITCLRKEYRFLIWHWLCKSTCRVSVTVYSRHTIACGCSPSAGTVLRKKNKQKIHATGSTTLGVSRRRRSTSKLECVGMFRLLRNIRTSSLKKLHLAGILSVWQYSFAFQIASLSEECSLWIWPRAYKSTCRVSITAAIAYSYSRISATVHARQKGARNPRGRFHYLSALYCQ